MQSQKPEIEKLKIIDFDSPNCSVTPNAEVPYQIEIRNMGKREIGCKIIIDIYPAVKPVHPARHFGYFAAQLSITPGAQISLNVLFDWNGNLRFYQGEEKLKIMDSWLGTIDEEGPYRLYLRLQTLKDELLEETHLLQTLLPEKKYLLSLMDKKRSPAPKTTDSGPKKEILIISDSLPHPDRDSGSLRLFSLMQILKKLRYAVTFFPYDCLYPKTALDLLEKQGFSILRPSACARMNYADAFLKTFLGQRETPFDYAVLSRPDSASRVLNVIREYQPKTKILYDTVDLHYLRKAREGETKRDEEIRREAQKYKEMEEDLILKADKTLAVTDDEKKLIQRQWPDAPVVTVPNVHKVSKTPAPFEKRSGLLFVGWFGHSPNEDAVYYFAEEILPLIQKKVPEINLHVLGGDVSEELLSLNNPAVLFRGYQENLAPFFAAAKVFIAPLRFGSGMKGKIGQSLSFGLPVVTTSVGAEGFGFEDRKTALLAEDPQSLADAVLNLLEDKMLWGRLSRNGIDLIRDKFSFEAVEKNLVQALQSE